MFFSLLQVRFQRQRWELTPNKSTTNKSGTRFQYLRVPDLFYMQKYAMLKSINHETHFCPPNWGQKIIR